MAGGAAAFAAIVCSVLSIRLMMVLEGAQIMVVGTIGQQFKTQRLMAMAIGAHKLFIINLSIAFFSRISYLLFWLEGMQTERAVHTAALTMLNSILISNKVRLAAKHTKRAARKMRTKASTGAVSCGQNIKSSVRRKSRRTLRVGAISSVSIPRTTVAGGV